MLRDGHTKHARPTERTRFNTSLQHNACTSFLSTPLSCHATFALQAAVHNAHSSKARTVVRLQLQHASVGSAEVLDSLRVGSMSSNGLAPGTSTREAVRLRHSDAEDEDGTMGEWGVFNSIQG